jgi:hypothetical protein
MASATRPVESLTLRIDAWFFDREDALIRADRTGRTWASAPGVLRILDPIPGQRIDVSRDLVLEAQSRASGGWATDWRRFAAYGGSVR